MVVATPQHAAFPQTVISSTPTMKAMVTPNTTTTSKKKSSSSGGGSKKKDAHDCPIFLKKTYHMIDGCDPAIASWAEDGKSFVIKDTGKFGTVVIPQFFKHNKISSFVRQLNFYGFRKVKVENIKINTALEETEGKYWRFRHEHFLRGRPDLLGDIRKANQMISPEQAEVDSLKKEVKNLKEKISGMTADIQKLTALVETVTQSQQEMQHQQSQGDRRVTFAEEESPTKKRKIDPAVAMAPCAPPSISACADSFSTIPDLPDLASATDSDLLIEHPPASYPEAVSSAAPYDLPPMPASSLRATSFGSVTSMDQDFAALFSDDLANDPMAALEHIVPDITESSRDFDPSLVTSDAISPQAEAVIKSEQFTDITPMKVTSTSVSPEPLKMTGDEPDPILVQKLRDSLACLPKKMQEVFVERLVATIATPEQFKESVQAVSALAAAAAGDAQRRLVMSERIPSSPSMEGSESLDSLMEEIEGVGDSEAERIGALPLAAAALAAFLTQYAGNSQDRQASQMETSSSLETRTAPSVVPPES